MFKTFDLFSLIIADSPMETKLDDTFRIIINLFHIIFKDFQLYAIINISTPSFCNILYPLFQIFN